ncbi:MAG: UrcA family protein [Vitreimonas sp.]
MKSSKISALALAAAGALTLIAAPSFAQEANDKFAYDDEIIVTAPYVEREVTGRDATGARIETLTTSRAVETGDLNLRYNSDVRELHRRISDAAANACREIEERSNGVPVTRRSECIRDAERSATAQAESLVDYARG